jgi:hypothetical protein
MNRYADKTNPTMYYYPNRTMQKNQQYCVETLISKRAYQFVYGDMAQYDTNEDEEIHYNPHRTDYARLAEEVYPNLTCYRSSPLRIIHTWSPYVVPSNRNASSSIFAPLDQAQNITWESMYRTTSLSPREYIGFESILLDAISKIDSSSSPSLCPRHDRSYLDRQGRL